MRRGLVLARGPLHFAAALILAAVGLFAAAGPAAAAAEPIGDCTTTSGVILAVDLQHWGGPILRACGTTPTTGYDLLNEGGWSTQGDAHDGPAFVCRIAYSGYDGGAAFPTPAQDACIVTPPASAYWSYWHANPGQNMWSYSQLGAMSCKPEPGSVDLWMFGATNVAGSTGSGVPTFSPNDVRALNTQPVGVSSPTGPNGGGGGAAGGGGAPSTTRAADTGAGSVPGQTSNLLPSGSSSSAPRASTSSATLHGSPGSSASAAGVGDSTQAAGAAGVPPIVNVTPVAASARKTSHGSAIPALVTLAAVLVLGGAGVAFALRRPRSHG